jgi:inhibitor of cysteine peptidase
MIQLRIGSISLAMVIGLLLLCLLCLEPCTTASPGPVEADEEPKPCQMICLTEADNGRVVELDAGAIIHLQLGWQPGTGYEWQVGELDRGVVMPLARDTSAQSPAPGGEEELHIFLRAERPGSTPLVLRYVRPWEEEKTSARTMRVQITVN